MNVESKVPVNCFLQHLSFAKRLTLRERTMLQKMADDVLLFDVEVSIEEHEILDVQICDVSVIGGESRVPMQIACKNTKRTIDVLKLHCVDEWLDAWDNTDEPDDEWDFYHDEREEQCCESREREYDKYYEEEMAESRLERMKDNDE